MRSLTKANVIRLRRQGYTYSDIASVLSISKSTAHFHASKINLSKSEQKLLRARVMELRNQSLQAMKMAKAAKINKRDLEMQLFVNKVITRQDLKINRLRIMCSLLFWAEGQKDIRSGMRLINSDPNLISTFLNMLRKSFTIDEAKFRVLMQLHSYHNAELQMRYWSAVTQIPLTQFYKSSLKSNTGKNYRKDYPGCISLRYVDSQFGKLLKMIYIEFSRNQRGVR